VEKGTDAKERVYEVEYGYEQEIVKSCAMYLSTAEGLLAEKTVFSV